MKSPKKEGMIIDSSLLSSEKKLTLPEYKEKLISLIQPILNRRFSDQPQKRKIRPYRDRISIACPYCGDSTHIPHKKRGNFILEGKHQNHYKCFNCGIFKRIDNFFKDYKEELELNIIDYIVENQGNFKTHHGAKYDSSLLLDLDSVEGYALDREYIKKKLNLEEIKGSSVEPWLRKRYQFQYENFLYHSINNWLIILNNTPSGKIIGFQNRKMGKLFSGQEKFLTYKISKLYKAFKIEEEIPDEIDSISELFGILKLNLNSPITLFEGPMDSFLFKNSIASAGANKTLPFDIPVRYWFDYDKTGIKKSIEYIERGYSVFLWERFQRDFGFPYRKKWDWNDIIIYFKNNNISLSLDLNDYFSKDPLDLIDL